VVSGANANLFQDIGIVAGRTYRVTYTLTYSAGGFQMIIGGTASTVKLASGTYTDYIVAGSSNLRVSAFGNAAFAGTIDNISVREFDAAQVPDKMTVFAGVRKLSDVNGAVVVESSINAASQNGAFGLSAPDNNGAATFGFSSRGSALAAVSVGSLSAPITRVATLLADISGDSLIGRLNGVQVGQSTTDQGTGTFTSQPIYIGMRQGGAPPTSNSAFFSGHLYSLIVRGAQSTADQISYTEAWVARETGFFTPVISGIPTVGVS
jgi:hypothetical protein